MNSRWHPLPGRCSLAPMFQTFSASTHPADGPPRLERLRSAMRKAGIDATLVPRADAHQGEYVAPCDDRLAWLTGFTGSAGFAAVTADNAGVFVDGRYRVQVRAQTAQSAFAPVDWPEVQLAPWLIEKLSRGAKLGFDPWLHSVDQIKTLTRTLGKEGIEVCPIDSLIDAIWEERPLRPKKPIRIHPNDLAGETSQSKRTRLAETLNGKPAVITLPDSICWLLNIRGSDIPRIPLVQGFAILHPDANVDFFTNAAFDDDVLGHLSDAVRLHPYDGLLGVLAEIDVPVQFDPKTAPEAVRRALKHPVAGTDPCLQPKAQKNNVELAGTSQAHLRDAAAMIEFLTWLDATALSGGLTEIDVVKALEEKRRATNALQDISFDTICGAGPNGAIVHYRVTEDTNAPLKPGQLLLVDSGGQYLDGTTDITRTIAIGDPQPIHRHAFTRVLQGMIAISRARWPRGLAGRDLDALARAPLWSQGWDYDHGTGHGVGVYLGVHEGPQSLSKRSDVPLQPGMILSNEPGYYREGAFGIRIENLVFVRRAPEIPEQDNRDHLVMETLTWVPIDRRLIDPDLLSQVERDWINTYHRDVKDKISPRLSDPARAWLETATAPV